MLCVVAGDTGLLDHLLKHLADKTVTMQGDKLRRRHNTEGHMEYWLQSPASAQTGMLLIAARSALFKHVAWHGVIQCGLE